MGRSHRMILQLKRGSVGGKHRV